MGEHRLFLYEKLLTNLMDETTRSIKSQYTTVVMEADVWNAITDSARLPSYLLPWRRFYTTLMDSTSFITM